MAETGKPTAETETGFLQRWSRRKASARDGEAPHEVATLQEGEGAIDADTEAAVPAPAETGEITPEELAELEKVDLETLTYETDFTPFMKKGVPAALRQAALRRLWRLNPVFANLDGLNDYDHNFNVVHTVLENIQTAYKVGEGYLTKAERAAMAGEPLPEDETADVTGEDVPEPELADAESVPAEGEGAALEEPSQVADSELKKAASPAGVDDLDDEDFV